MNKLWTLETMDQDHNKFEGQMAIWVVSCSLCFDVHTLSNQCGYLCQNQGVVKFKIFCQISCQRTCSTLRTSTNFMAKNLQHLKNLRLKSLFGDRALKTKNVFSNKSLMDVSWGSLDNKYFFYSNGCASSSKNFPIYILFSSMDVAFIMDLNVLFWTELCCNRTLT